MQWSEQGGREQQAEVGGGERRQPAAERTGQQLSVPSLALLPAHIAQRRRLPTVCIGTAARLLSLCRQSALTNTNSSSWFQVSRLTGRLWWVRINSFHASTCCQREGGSSRSHIAIATSSSTSFLPFSLQAGKGRQQEVVACLSSPGRAIAGGCNGMHAGPCEQGNPSAVLLKNVNRTRWLLLQVATKGDCHACHMHLSAPAEQVGILVDLPELVLILWREQHREQHA